MNITQAVLLSSLAVLFAGCASPRASEADLLAALANYEKGWNTGDVALTMQDYSEQVDWTNAYGTRVRSREELQALLTEIFAMPTVMAGELEYVSNDVTNLGGGVALLRSTSNVHGQQLVDGSPHGPRVINHLRVFVRKSGRWVIVSHLISQQLDPSKL